MEVEEAIYARLTGDAAVTAALGARIHPGQGEEGEAFPLAVYTQASQQYVMALARRLATSRYSMHVDVWGDDYAEVKAAYHAVRDCLAGYSGDITSGGSTVTVLGIFDEGGDDDASAPIHAEENGLWRAGIDLSIFYQKGA